MCTLFSLLLCGCIQLLCVLWLKAVSLDFRCGGICVDVDENVDVVVSVYVLVFIVVGTD